MNIRILLFSVLREKVGRKELDLTADSPLTADDLWNQLAGRYSALAPYGQSVRIAVNRTYVGGEHPLADGDEVALITPVSGG